MRKQLFIFCAAITLALTPGCAQNNSAQNTVTDSNQNLAETDNAASEQAEHKDAEETIQQDTKDYIQNAIDNANLIASSSFFMDQDQNFFFQNDRKYYNMAYAYYGKKIKQLRGTPSGMNVLAVLEDGSLYNGTSLITNEYRIKDVLWKTNNVNLDAYLITEDGKVLYYNPAHYDKTTCYGYNQLSLEGENHQVVAGCRYRSSIILLDKDGNPYGDPVSTDWSGCEIKGWKDAVVMACTQNEKLKTASIAAIAADGTVYATGDYADEILSWGELAYITMDETLIVGLKKDGTLVFAGENAEKFSGLNLSGVKAVRAFREALTVMTKDGFSNYSITSYDSHSDDNYYAYSRTNSETPGQSSEYDLTLWMMDAEGRIRQPSDGSWEDTEYAPASVGMEETLIYSQELQQEEISWGTNIMDYPYTKHPTSSLSFQFLDINEDGRSEIFLSDGYETALGCLGNGEMRTLLCSTSMEGYYPGSGILVCREEGEDGDFFTYWLYENETIQELGYISSGSDHYISKKIKTDDTDSEEDADPDSDYIHLSESEFNDLLQTYVNGAKLKEVSTTSFMANTEENRASLSGQSAKNNTENTKDSTDAGETSDDSTPQPDSAILSAALSAYQKYLSYDRIGWNGGEYDSTEYKFALVDINSDGIPELLVHCNEEPEWPERVYYYYNGFSTEAALGSDFTCYYPSSGIIAGLYIDVGGGEHTSYFKIPANGEAEQLGLSDTKLGEGIPDSFHWKKQQGGEIEDVTEDEFFTLLEQEAGTEKIDITDSIWLDNTPENREQIGAS